MGKKEVMIDNEKTIVMSEAQFRTILENAINKAQQSAFLAGKRDAKREQEIKDKQSFNAYKETEKRLYGYPVLKERLITLKEELEDIIDHPYLPGHSKDICLYSRANDRLSDEEIIDQRIQGLEGRLYADKAEIVKIDAALKIVKQYPYYEALLGKYFKNKSIEDLATELKCDKTTIYRNLSPMVNRIAVWLYGEQAYGVAPLPTVGQGLT